LTDQQLSRGKIVRASSQRTGWKIVAWGFGLEIDGRQPQTAQINFEAHIHTGRITRAERDQWPQYSMCGLMVAQPTELNNVCASELGELLFDSKTAQSMLKLHLHLIQMHCGIVLEHFSVNVLS
jgi:hypothetical protein